MEESGFVDVKQFDLPEPRASFQRQLANKAVNVLLGVDAGQKVIYHRAALSDGRIKPVFFLAQVKSA